MDLHHILQPQPGHGRGRTPKRPSLASRGSATASAAQRTTTVSSEPRQSRSTPPPPAGQSLSSSFLPSLSSQNLQSPHPSWLSPPEAYLLPASTWPTALPDQGTSQTAPGLSAPVDDDEDYDDDDDDEIDEFELDLDLENVDDEGDEEGDDDDAFSLEFTLDSDTSHNDDLLDHLPPRRLSPRSHLGRHHHPHSFNNSSHTPQHSSHSTFTTTPTEPIDLTRDPSSPMLSRTAPTQTSQKRDRNQTPDASASSGSKRRRTSQRHDTEQSASQSRHVQEIDLVGSDDEDSLAKALSKQREEQIKAQVPVASEPTKLQNLQCTVCLDTPTDLTATVCGHAFCRKCLLEWLIAGEKEHPRRSNCPACRKQIKRSAKHDTIPLEIMVRPRQQVRTVPRLRGTEGGSTIS